MRLQRQLLRRRLLQRRQLPRLRQRVEHPLRRRRRHLRPLRQRPDLQHRQRHLRRNFSTGPCTWTGGPSSTNGEITCYWFGQGTAKGGGCGSFKTYCGYCGTESGSNNGGTCPTGITDGVPNTGTSYFAAFPVGSFGQGTYCGMCVDVTWMGKTITATIVDECATCPTSSHIDLSLTAAVALGLGQGTTTGDPKTGVTWKAVDCPVTGNIVGVFNGSSQQIYFQNVTFPVAKAVAGGHTATQAFGYWDFGVAVGGNVGDAHRQRRPCRDGDDPLVERRQRRHELCRRHAVGRWWPAR